MQGLRLLLLLMGFGSSEVFGQPHAVNDVRILEDSLAKLGHTMYNEPSEPERLEANFTFVKTLVSALKTPNSYSFPFDSLDMVSILKAPDDRFRIFSWHIPLNDGSYLYYGTIQLNTPDGGLKMYPLLDKTYEIGTPETAVVTPENWYGAQYYRIIPFNGDYLLLGWKGHNPQVNQKVVEVLQVNDQNVQLGKAIFDSDSTAGYARMIYRYNRNVTMYLDYDWSENRILLDHLSPADVRAEGQYEQYGPDMTYDAWQLAGDRLTLISDIPLMNPPEPNDDQYNDPKKPQNHPKSGFDAQ